MYALLFHLPYAVAHRASPFRADVPMYLYAPGTNPQPRRIDKVGRRR